MNNVQIYVYGRCPDSHLKVRMGATTSCNLPSTNTCVQSGYTPLQQM